MAHVTVADVATRVAYTVGGTPQSAFTIPFAYFDPTDIVVYVGGVLKTYSTDFSVSGVSVDGGYSGGTVTLTVAVSNTTVVVQRDTPTARTEDFPYPSSTLNIKALNTALDKIAAWAQQLKAKASRALRQPEQTSKPSSSLASSSSRSARPETSLAASSWPRRSSPAARTYSATLATETSCAASSRTSSRALFACFGPLARVATCSASSSASTREACASFAYHSAVAAHTSASGPVNPPVSPPAEIAS